MILSPGPFKRLAGAAALIAALTVAAAAADHKKPAKTPAAPAAPAKTSAAPAANIPSAKAVEAAQKIIADIGMQESIGLVVPGMLTELERNITMTRPEIKDELRKTLEEIRPEFDKNAVVMLAQAAVLLAQQMSEKDIVAAAAFFDSPAGKAYLAAEPKFLEKLKPVAEAWRQQLSTDMMTRARDAMKKKGVDF